MINLINIKSKSEVDLMKIAGRIVYDTHQHLIPYIKPGIKTIELDKIAEDYILSRDATPSFKNYDGFPSTLCISINNQVVHGIPGNRKLKEGDIVSIDIGACYKGYHGDSAWTYGVGKISKEKQDLMDHTEEALFNGLKAIKPGNRIGDISKGVEEIANKYNLGIVKELVGHGVGSVVHEDPCIPNYITNDKGAILKEGMTLAIEPMLNLGSSDIYICEDDWTIETEDGSPSAHFEHTVVVTSSGYKILTGE
ncbi:MAG: type I methionyl aminopeptidase [Bacilli bacterium]